MRSIVSDSGGGGVAENIARISTIDSLVSDAKTPPISTGEAARRVAISGSSNGRMSSG